VRVDGTVAYTHASGTDQFVLNAGERIQVVTPTGGIILSNTAGLPGGVLRMTSPLITVTDAALAAQLAANPNFAGRNDALFVNSGAVNARGYLQGGGIAFTVGNGLFIQNTGTSTDFAGVAVGAAGLAIRGSTAAPISVVGYGRRHNADGSFTTGEPFFALVDFGKGAGTSYTADSELNECNINAGCPVPPAPTTPTPPTPTPPSPSTPTPPTPTPPSPSTPTPPSPSTPTPPTPTPPSPSTPTPPTPTPPTPTPPTPEPPTPEPPRTQPSPPPDPPRDPIVDTPPRTPAPTPTPPEPAPPPAPAPEVPAPPPPSSEGPPPPPQAPPPPPQARPQSPDGVLGTVQPPAPPQPPAGLVDTGSLTAEPLIEEPVAGGGDSSLWSEPDEDDEDEEGEGPAR
jgi:hypothetical protein